MSTDTLEMLSTLLSTAFPSNSLLLAFTVVTVLTTNFLLYVYYTVSNPVIISHPYPSPEATPPGEKDNVVLLAGSYNPPHKGHLEMLKHLSSTNEKVYAVVGFNPSKKYPVAPEDRVKMLQAMTTEAKLTNVVPVLVSGLIWRWASSNSVKVMYRGVRTWKEDGSDESMLHFQNTFFPLILGPFTFPIKTRFLAGSPEFNHVSSTLIRGICKGENVKAAREKLEGLVGATQVDRVIKLYGEDDDGK
jgi:pantetheine-phosphate adenylyltransferase